MARLIVEAIEQASIEHITTSSHRSIAHLGSLRVAYDLTARVIAGRIRERADLCIVSLTMEQKLATQADN